MLFISFALLAIAGVAGFVGLIIHLIVRRENADRQESYERRQY